MTGQKMMPQDVKNELVLGAASGKAHAPEQLGEYIRQLEGIILEAGFARSVGNAKVGNPKDKPWPKQIIGRPVLDQNVAGMQIPMCHAAEFHLVEKVKHCPQPLKNERHADFVRELLDKLSQAFPFDKLGNQHHAVNASIGILPLANILKLNYRETPKRVSLVHFSPPDFLPLRSMNQV